VYYVVSVKRSCGYNYSVAGVGHTSLSSASIRSGEIIIVSEGKSPCCVLRSAERPQPPWPGALPCRHWPKLRLGLSNNLRVLPSHLWPSLVPTGSHPVDRFIHTLSKNSQAPIRIVKCDALAVTAPFPPVLHHSPAGTSTISLYSVLYWTLLFSLYLCHVEVNFSYPGRMLVCLQSALKARPTYLPTHIWKDVTKLPPFMG
jgi:hypothetical protein